mmetsp:Transcript_23645/g.35897  ORF Transcript_23645/g.35897 Transcript_23645/m.35897 type:complete len:81 (-) Transcript_23645:33-275(-)
MVKRNSKRASLVSASVSAKTDLFESREMSVNVKIDDSNLMFSLVPLAGDLAEVSYPLNSLRIERRCCGKMEIENVDVLRN